MVYEVKREKKEKMGLTITISPYRKHGNGAKGGGRKNKSGKQAIIKKEGIDDVVIKETSATTLLRAVRGRFKIPHDIQINRKGETHI